MRCGVVANNYFVAFAVLMLVATPAVADDAVVRIDTGL
jgi:hypothetical protein